MQRSLIMALVAWPVLHQFFLYKIFKKSYTSLKNNIYNINNNIKLT